MIGRLLTLGLGNGSLSGSLSYIITSGLGVEVPYGYNKDVADSVELSEKGEAVRRSEIAESKSSST